jgi:hypothetical protein
MGSASETLGVVLQSSSKSLEPLIVYVKKE